MRWRRRELRLGERRRKEEVFLVRSFPLPAEPPTSSMEKERTSLKIVAADREETERVGCSKFVKSDLELIEMEMLFYKR